MKYSGLNYKLTRLAKVQFKIKIFERNEKNSIGEWEIFYQINYTLTFFLILL